MQWVKSNDALGKTNRGVPCESGLCTLCDSGCRGKCETWMASLKGRKMLYPRDFGNTLQVPGIFQRWVSVTMPCVFRDIAMGFTGFSPL